MKSAGRGPEFRVSQAVYACLARAYPRSHRAVYGAAMAQLFRDQCRDAWSEARAWGLCKLWARTLPDLACTSIVERLAALKERKTMTEKLADPFAFRFPSDAVFYRVFAAVFLLVFLGGAVVTFQLPVAYSSTARIRVENDAAGSPGVGGSLNLTAYDPYFIQTTFGILQSELVLSNVIAALDLNTIWGLKYANGETLKPSESMAILKQRMLLAPIKNSKLISITVYSEDNREAAAIANAIANSYARFRQDARAALATQGRLESPDSPQVGERRPAPSLPPRSLVQITDVAEPGRAPVRPNKPLNLVLAAAAGILLATAAGAALAGLARSRRRRMQEAL